MRKSIYEDVPIGLGGDWVVGGVPVRQVVRSPSWEEFQLHSAEKNATRTATAHAASHTGRIRRGVQEQSDTTRLDTVL